jgi:hypothetical protein
MMVLFSFLQASLFMKTLALAILAAFALTSIGVAPAQAQDSNASSQTHTVKKAAEYKKPVKKAQPAKKKHVVKKKAAKEVKKVEAAVPVESPTERLSSEELALAPKVYTGDMRCELGEDVKVTADGQHPGFFHVTAGKRQYYMHPVVSKTGAMRLEDNRAGAVWLQLGGKSMLLDQKRGERVADSCAGAAQRDYAAHMSQHPAPDLLGLDKK